MKKVVIDKNFFQLNPAFSGGLISGLKKLQQNGFLIQADKLDLNQNPQLKKVLQLEDILINPKEIKNAELFFSISTGKNSDPNSIIVSEGSEINSFEKAVDLLLIKMRSAKQKRKTKETDIELEVSLDGTGKSIINTGLGFFDHMLEQIAKHANLNLRINVKGDLHVDEHHTVEDVGIVLGTSLNEALGNKKGIKRYGYFLPMDDSIARCAIDLGGRAYLNFKCKFEREKVGEFPTELTEEFFRALSSGMKANIYIRAKGKNDHHKIEAVFKAFAKSLNEACRIENRSRNILPSTKGVL